jgi:DNA-binding XRE family transcriptional regulator
MCAVSLRREGARTNRADRGEDGMVKKRPSKLRVARETLGLTQEKAAVAAGISLAWLRAVERHPDLLSERVAAKLLPILGLSAKSR